MSFSFVKFLAVVADGTRNVFKLTDWIAGTDIKPELNETNSYLDTNGLTDLANAVDIRGFQGKQGLQGGQVLSGIDGNTAHGLGIYYLKKPPAVPPQGLSG